MIALLMSTSSADGASPVKMTSSELDVHPLRIYTINMMNKKEINMPVDNSGYTPLYNQHVLIQSIKSALHPILDGGFEREKIERRDLAELYAVAMKIEKSHNEQQLNMLAMFTGRDMYAERGKKDTR